jgi:ribonuclease P protein component
MYSLMKARKDYVRLSRTGKRFFFDGFIAQAVPVNDRIGMVGITVTKKLGGSVDRHRAKRRLREVIRLWKKENSVPITYDVVLVARSKIFDLDFKNLQMQWAEMLGRLEKNQDWTHETINR